MADKIQMAVRINRRVKKAVEKACRSRGLIMSRFVEEAIIDRLDEMEDIKDLPKLLREPTRPFSEVMKELRKNG